ncbi:hypothetical protein [Clostridium gasigenes]|uniref:hypothetical protein n=1 Tax=Clostridium gasigenes TaxID=94869 RepID=UPI001C0B7460|nr:hypothetical protein [Clostridium gasigenes]MBU3107442.1 hypothetical protein [Clostridium gasigenes]
MWAWDITCLNTYTKGFHFKLYTIIDIYIQKIVGWQIGPKETVPLAADLVEIATLT